MQLGGWSYLGIFVATASLAWVLTPLALRIALRTGTLDHPGAIKAQQEAVPYLGGLAIVGAFSAAVMAASLLRPPVSGLTELGTILGLGLLLSGLGLLDDVRGLGPTTRLAVEVVAALAVYAAGIQVQLFHVAALDAFVTVIWVVGVINAFNILDNMDGLSAGIAAISGFSFFLIAATNGQFLVAGLAIAVAGCAVGFLRHNFHPAKIYMGDAGSLYLGFLLAVLGIKLQFDAPVELTFIVPIMVLGVAIFDTVLVTATRLANGKSPWSGGRDHSSHRLVFVGIPVPIAVSLIYLAQISLGWLALIMTRLELTTGLMLMGFVIVISTLIAVLLGMVPVYEHSTRRRLMIREIKQHEVEPELSPADKGATPSVVSARN